MDQEQILTHNKNVQDHDCTLPNDEETVVHYIDSGMFVNFRRKFRKFLMVDAKNPETKAKLKSTAQIRLEEERHLQHYYHMVHPFSNGRFVWENIMIFVYLLLLFIIPIDISSYDKVDEELIVLKVCLDIISWIDIGMWFITGYYDQERQKIILEPKKVALRYLFPFFVIDLLSSLPVSAILFYMYKEDLIYYKFFSCLKLFRCNTLFRYMRNSLERLQFSSYSLKSLNFSFYLLFAIIWATCITYLFRVRREHDYTFERVPDLFQRLVLCCHDVIYRLMVVYNWMDDKYEFLDLTFQISCVVWGMIFCLIMLAQVQQFYNRRSNAKNKYENLIQQIGEYMKYKELPNHLKDKVFHYVDFKFQKNIFKEADILNTLSTILRQDILLHNCKRLIERVDFFKDLPTALIQRIVSKLKTEIYLPNDVIVQAGIAGNAMYFIYIGTVAVYTSTGKEICHLRDGSHFGEIALIINEPRVASCVAVKECELYRLSRKDFQEAMEPFPEISNKIRISALARLETTRKIAEEHSNAP